MTTNKPRRKDTLTYERATERLSYDPETGVFTWAMDIGDRMYRPSISTADWAKVNRELVESENES